MEKLREFRLNNNLSQEEMAKIIGVTYSYYCKVETGRANASSNFMKKFKRAFPLENIDYIFFDTQPQ